MSFNDIAGRILGGTAEYKFCTTLYGRDAFFIEGAVPVRLDEKEMIFRAGRTLITFTGERLYVVELSDDTAAVRGSITGVAVSDI